MELWPREGIAEKGEHHALALAATGWTRNTKNRLKLIQQSSEQESARPADSEQDKKWKSLAVN
jgi:hypothetical protein